MNRLGAVFERISAPIAGRRLSLVAVGSFALVAVINAQFPELTTVYSLALLVAGVLVVVAGYHRRNVAWSLLLGSAPILGELTAYVVRALFVAPDSITLGWLVRLYSRVPYALLIAGVLYVLGRALARGGRALRTDDDPRSMS